MSSKQKLTKAVEYLINEQTDKAIELMKSYIIETAAEIHQRIIENDEDINEMDREIKHDDMGDDLSDEVSSNKKEIQSEEMFGEDAEEGAEEHGHEGDVMDLDMDMDLDGEEGHDGEDEFGAEDEHTEVSDLKADVDELNTRLDDFEDTFDTLAAAFEKIKDTEEVEHDEDFDDDGKIDGEVEHGEVEHGDEEGHDDFDFGDEESEEPKIEESVELFSVKPDMKDKSPNGSEKGRIPSEKDRSMSITKWGEPVKITDKGHKGYERETMKVKEVTKNSNTVKSGKDALTKTSVDMKDKAPGAGPSTSMPKGKK